MEGIWSKQFWSEYESVQMCVRSVWLIHTQWGGEGLQMAPLPQPIYCLKTWKTWCSIFDCIQISYGNRSGEEKKKNNMISAVAQRSHSNYAFEFPLGSKGFHIFRSHLLASSIQPWRKSMIWQQEQNTGFPGDAETTRCFRRWQDYKSEKFS